jgi:uncharacterized protein YndB with AHSA1/START domain
MSIDSQSLKFTQKINAPVSQVYEAFSTATGLSEWLCDFARTGKPCSSGFVFLRWNSGYHASGVYTDVEENRRVGFTWHGLGEPHPTEVVVSLKKENGTTTVTLEHKGIGTGDDWEKKTEDIKAGWETGLKNLQSVLESGIDPRIYSIPLMGILVSDEVNPEMAERKGFHVDYGVLLAGVVQGMGAEEAGLRKGDIMVSLGGYEVKNLRTLSSAVEHHKAGDVVEVIISRGDQKITLDMRLSGRPKPDFPESAQGLADRWEKLHAKANAKLGSLLENITEEETDYHPVPGEWNVKEILAHFIVNERNTISWVGSLLAGQEIEAFVSDTQLPRLKSLLSIFPTIPQLVAELERAQAETVALLAELPPDFMSHKGRVAYIVTYLRDGAPFHYKDHISQIASAIEAARSVD